MKNPLFALITCGSALGLMTGAVAVHALHVAGAEELSESTGWNPAVLEDRTSAGLAPVGTTLIGTRSKTAPTPVSVSHRSDEVTVRALEAIADRLETLSEANQNLRGQNQRLQQRLEKTNQKLGTIELTVDSHSKEFRPIPRTTEESILEGADASRVESQSLLLPPKDW